MERVSEFPPFLRLRNIPCLSVSEPLGCLHLLTAVNGAVQRAICVPAFGSVGEGPRASRASCGTVAFFLYWGIARIPF